MAERVAIDGASAEIFREAPGWDGLRTSAVGRFSCQDPSAGTELLRRICARLADDGYRAVIGPMDGDTWHAYRVVTESDGSPAFLLEPTSGPHDLASFAAAGFERISHYVSARQDLPASVAPSDRPEPDLVVDHWDGTDAEAVFTQVHALSTQAFARNPFYRPIPLEDFLAIYLPMVPLIRPELVFFARTPDGALQGFFFAIPNYQEGPAPKGVIFKTYASLVPGAGHMLVRSATRAASVLGFDYAIHALMNDENLSVRRSDRLQARVFRRYALMGRRLDG